MRFEDYKKDGKVVPGQKDMQQVKSLINMSSKQLFFIQTLEVTDMSASTILSSSYESLRQILEAMCLSEGWKVYSHEAFTVYLRELGEERIAHQFDRLRKLRNGVHYYGNPVSPDVAEKSREHVASMREELVERYLSWHA